jgi:hypothetical protein
MDFSWDLFRHRRFFDINHLKANKDFLAAAADVGARSSPKKDRFPDKI